MDAALGAIAPRRGAELRAHLESCPGCRAALEERKELVAAIDRGIRDNLAGEPSRDFAARLRRRLAEESPAKLSWAEAWAPVAAGALAALAVAAVWLAQHDPIRPGRSDSARNAPAEALAQVATVPPVGAPSGVAPPLPSGQPPALRGGDRPGATPVSSPAAEPEVLVPPGQREAILALYRAVWSRRVDGSSLIKESPPVEPEELKVPLLEIAGLQAETKALEPGEDR